MKVITLHGGLVQQLRSELVLWQIEWQHCLLQNASQSPLQRKESKETLLQAKWRLGKNEERNFDNYLLSLLLPVLLSR